MTKKHLSNVFLEYLEICPHAINKIKDWPWRDNEECSCMVEQLILETKESNDAP